MNPYISGQNSAKFGGRKFIDLRKQYWTEEGKCSYQSWNSISSSDVRGVTLLCVGTFYPCIGIYGLIFIVMKHLSDTFN